MKSSLATSGKSLQEKFIQEFTEVSKSIQVSSKYSLNKKQNKNAILKLKMTKVSLE
jgi:hypothetical protein